MMGQDEPLFSVVTCRTEKIKNKFYTYSGIDQNRIQWFTLDGLGDMHFPQKDILIVDCSAELSSSFLPTLKSGVFSLAVVDDASDIDISHIKNSFTDYLYWSEFESQFTNKLSRLEQTVKSRNKLERILTMKLNLIGASTPFQSVLDKVEKFSRCTAPVLILGETGTGKEQISRALHYLGSAEGQPFVAVNCGAIPDSLFENELFGHVQGAYTDARKQQPGLVEQAEGGTLFLDEIEALSTKGQITLLRFLQDYEYRPLGSTRGRKASIRIIAASNESLTDLIEQGGFRKDLFYRLNILTINIPPLRERKGDVRLLVNYFLQKYRDSYKQEEKYLDEETIRWMESYDWPGNVRELESLLMREFLLADSSCIAFEMNDEVKEERRENIMDRRYRHLLERSFHDAKSIIVNDFERQYLKNALKTANGNITRAARQAGKERRTFSKLLEKHGIKYN